MTAYADTDGSFIVPVNAYKDLHLLRYISPDLVFDCPGDHVFCSDKGQERGKVLTFLQSKAGYNIFSVDGFGQVLGVLDLGGIWWQKFLKKSYASPLEMFKTFSMFRVLGSAPPTVAEEDEFVVDLLLLDPLSRIERARAKDPERLLYSTIKIIHSFLDRASYASYKPRYRQKLLELSSKLTPYRRELAKLELDFSDPETSLYILLLMFT